jgi:hypothetical protein
MGLNDSIKFNFYIVALIDLLGQIKALERFEEIPTSEAERTQFSEVAKKTIGRVIDFRESISEINQIVNGPIQIPQEIVDKIPRSQVPVIERYLNPTTGIQFFSDMAILKINLVESDKFFPLMSILSLFSQLSIIMFSQLANGSPVRGAVDLGICAEIGNNDLYGQALSRAHILERNANYPRILISQNVIDYLDSLKRINSHQKIERNLINGLLAYIETVIERDDYDNKWVLSFLSPTIVSSYNLSEKEFNEYLELACSFISKELHEDDSSLAEKYEPLKNYFIKQRRWVED